MPAWGWWVPLGLVCVLGMALAFRAGWIVATMTETDVINTYAKRYVEEDGPEGASYADCVAVAGQVDGAWISVLCGEIAYHVSRFGGLIDATPQGPEA